jgi:transaldolase
MVVLTDKEAVAGSVVERLAGVNPGTEIWWDSSPLVYETWRENMLEAAAPDERDELEAALLRLWDPSHPEATLFRGVTTNPPLSLAAMRDDPPRWATWIRTYRATHPQASDEEMFWATYKEVVRLGATSFMPVYLASGYRDGHISAQVDPRNAFDTETMTRQAIELSAISPNVMIKVPGSREGLPVLRELTRRGISTNCTLAYTVGQFVAVAENVQAGLLEARADGVDLTGWKSVVTDMSARWEAAPDFETEAQEHGIELTVEDRRWAGIAVFKRAFRLYRERAYPSKMLLCSVRVGPEDHGCSHLEHTAGADVVFTLPPAFLTDFIPQCEALSFKPRIWEDIPREVMARLEEIPYFTRGYEPDGLTVGEFDDLPCLQSTVREFSKATDEMVSFVREHGAAGPR